MTEIIAEPVCRHEWIACEWKETIVPTGRATAAPVTKVTKIFCTFCEKTKDIS